MLKIWWDDVILKGRKLGHFVNEMKSWLILIDPENLQNAKDIFNNSKIKITTEGKRHLGAALGSTDFKTSYVNEKVRNWCKELEKLSQFAETQPQAAFSAYIHGEQHRFSYFLRTIPGIENLLSPLDNVIDSKFISALLSSEISTTERELFSLPIRLGRLGMARISEKSTQDFEASVKITAPLCAIMIMQGNTLPPTNRTIRNEVQQQKEANLAAKSIAIENQLTESTLRAVQQTKEKVASSWLSALPLEGHKFTLNKSEFRDALSLRYNRDIKDLPSTCPCGATFNVTHALNCKKRRFYNYAS